MQEVCFLWDKDGSLSWTRAGLYVLFYECLLVGALLRSLCSITSIKWGRISHRMRIKDLSVIRESPAHHDRPIYNGTRRSVVCFSSCDAFDEYAETVRPSHRSTSAELTSPGVKIARQGQTAHRPIHHLTFYGSHLQINTVPARACVWFGVTSGESINGTKRCVHECVIMLLDLSAVRLWTLKVLKEQFFSHYLLTWWNMMNISGASQQNRVAAFS